MFVERVRNILKNSSDQFHFELIQVRVMTQATQIRVPCRYLPLPLPLPYHTIPESIQIYLKIKCIETELFIFKYSELNMVK